MTKPSNGMPPAAEVIEPAREQDRESAVAVHVAGHGAGLARHREDPIVERPDDVLDRAPLDGAEILRRDVDLNPTPDTPQDARHRHVVAGDAGVALADHQVEHAIAGRQAPGRGLFRRPGREPDGFGCIGTGPVQSTVVGQLGDRGGRGGAGGQTDGERPAAPGECGDDDERLRPLPMCGEPKRRPPVPDRNRPGHADPPEDVRARPIARRLRADPARRQGEQPGRGQQAGEAMRRSIPGPRRHPVPTRQNGRRSRIDPPSDRLVNSHSIGARRERLEPNTMPG